MDLLHRIRSAAERTGEHEEELAAIEATLALLDRGRQPLLASELLVRRNVPAGRDGSGLRRACRRDRGGRPVGRSPGQCEHRWPWPSCPRSRCGATCPAERRAPTRRSTLALACGSATALTYALDRPGSGTRGVVGAGNGGLADAERAQAAAAEVRDHRAFTLAVVRAWTTWTARPAGRSSSTFVAVVTSGVAGRAARRSSRGSAGGGVWAASARGLARLPRTSSRRTGFNARALGRYVRPGWPRPCWHAGKAAGPRPRPTSTAPRNCSPSCPAIRTYAVRRCSGRARRGRRRHRTGGGGRLGRCASGGGWPALVERLIPLAARAAADLAQSPSGPR